MEVASEAAELAMCLAERQVSGSNSIFTRLKTYNSGWFTYEIEGDEVILTDALRAGIEAFAEGPLIEGVDPLWPGEECLKFEAGKAKLIVDMCAERGPHPSGLVDQEFQRRLAQATSAAATALAPAAGEIEGVDRPRQA